MSSTVSSDPDTRTSLDILVSCVRNQLFGVPLPGQYRDVAEQLPHLTRFARRHLVLPSLHAAMASTLDATLPAAVELENAHLSSVGNHLRILADLARLASVLESVGAAWVVVKGPVLAETFYPRPELRSYDDLDVLVDPRSLGDVIEALEDSGAGLLDVNWPLIRSSRRGELTLVLWHGTVLDLHWDLITERSVRRSFALRTPDLLERRRHLSVGSLSIPTLGPGDTLVYVALHALLAGGDRLGWLADMGAVMRRDGALIDSDWRVADRQRCALAVAIMLDRSRRVIDDPQAHASLDALSHTWAWRGLVRACDRVRTPETLPMAFSMRVLARSTRGSSQASLGAAARTTWDGVLKPLANRRNPWSASRPTSSAPGNPLWIADGTSADRRECLREIALTSSR